MNASEARYRYTMMCQEGMVASAHPLASLSGIEILKAGGNAFDAAIAVNAVLNVTQPHACGIGGDIFYVLYDAKSGSVRCINGSGRSARASSIEIYEEKGLVRIPEKGILAAITVPGCVAGWESMLNEYGSMRPQQLLAPAIKYAERGFPVSHGLSRWINESLESWARGSQFKPWRDTLARNGYVRPGDILVQKDLAKTFKIMAKEGLDTFYSGSIADAIVGSLSRAGGLLSNEDLSKHRSEFCEPPSTSYRGFDVYETPPNSQGITALIWLNILESFDIRLLGHNTPENLHIMIEAKKLAFEDRAKYITDPDFLKPPVGTLLSKEYAATKATLISKTETIRLGQGAFRKAHSDTTYLATVDKDRNCVSCIQSLYHPFGSGVIIEGTGILLQNRGSYFTLERSHHNRLESSKRTFHTLCASLALQDGEPFLVFGAAGADGQPQIHVQIFSAIFDFGIDIQQALEAPRFFMPGTIYESVEQVLMEDRFPNSTFEKLRLLGHEIQPIPYPSRSAGEAHAIMIDSKRGVLLGGADPRGDGIALGY
jgi:gamma-glutamyltranspeptidase/glutathione hydrolase